MITLYGKWYDGKTAGQTDVVCRIYDSGSVHVEKADDNSRIATLPRFDLDISARLADTPRYLKFPGGAKLETLDNDSVDRLKERFGRSSWLDMVHRLESRFKYVLVGLVIMLAFLWGSFQYGIPWTARIIANMLPPSILDLASQQTLAMLERSVLSPTELDSGTRERLKAHFRPLTASHADYHLNIIFKKGGNLGANAFALPDGTIIFTDEMVDLAQHDQELSAVLAHEIGHVVCRHGMRSIVQDSLLGFAILAITGDISGSSELFVGLPVLLTELAYSREFEREADQYALTYMQDHAIELKHFANLMRRVEQSSGGDAENGKKKWINYLSTHPMTEERLAAFE
jgi:Zn-dependent protease with chaperone function